MPEELEPGVEPQSEAKRPEGGRDQRVAEPSLDLLGQALGGAGGKCDMPYHHLGAAPRGEAAFVDGKLSAASDDCSGGNEPSAAGEASSRPDAAPDGSAACAHVASASSFVSHDVVCKSDPCAGRSPAETALTLGATVGGRQGRRQEKMVRLKLKRKYFDEILNGLKTM